jgi:hypothetical protein
MHVDFVLKYMFVVSICVIIPLLGLVIYTTRRAIVKLWWRLEEGVVERRKRVWREKSDERDLEIEVISAVSSMLDKNEDRKIGHEKKTGERVKWPSWRKKAKVPVCDQEKGELSEG